MTIIETRLHPKAPGNAKHHCDINRNFDWTCVDGLVFTSATSLVNKKKEQNSNGTHIAWLCMLYVSLHAICTSSCDLFFWIFFYICLTNNVFIAYLFFKLPVWWFFKKIIMLFQINSQSNWFINISGLRIFSLLLSLPGIIRGCVSTLSVPGCFCCDGHVLFHSGWWL